MPVEPPELLNIAHYCFTAPTRIGALTPCNYGVLRGSSKVTLGERLCDQYIAVGCVSTKSTRVAVST